MSKHRHRFVEVYDGMIAFGFSREVDENSLKYYLQKFSDDELLETLVPRLSEEEMHRLFDRLNELMKNHLSDDEYHRLFLKD
jgi:TorA maturation chaperone TorD